MLKIMAMIATASVVLVGCVSYQKNEPMIGMANPASVYCEKIGGQSLIKKEDSGDIGYCRLQDGTVTEEWKLYHARNKK